MLAAFVALSRASGRTFLVDGTAVLHTLSIPELARTSFAAKGPILGVPFVEAAWVLLFAGVAIATPLVPLHGWLPEAMEEAPAGVAMVLGGVVVALGPYLLVRVGLGAMPEGARWAGASMAALGVLSVAYGGLCAMAQRDLRRFVAYASIASGGACLFGVGAFTSQGIAGAVAGLFAHGLAAAMLLGVAGALERRLRTCELASLGGLAGEAPALAAVTATGLAVSLGVPALGGLLGAAARAAGRVHAAPRAGDGARGGARGLGGSPPARGAHDAARAPGRGPAREAAARALRWAPPRRDPARARGVHSAGGARAGARRVAGAAALVHRRGCAGREHHRRAVVSRRGALARWSSFNSSRT